MGIWRFLFGGIFLFSFCSFKLGDRILEAESGDYIVTEQDRNYSILLLKEKEKNHILFEEITVPTHMIERPHINWKQWLSKGAQNHTSWIQYEIDAGSLELLEAYSFSRKGWLYMGESDHFLSKLLSLPLSNIPVEERKKIGPAPQEGVDRRKVWSPPFFSNGEKIQAVSEAWKALWPQDSSLLSSCQITLYFPPKEFSSFPSWIEANNGHFSYSIKMIDSGKNMISPLKGKLPHRPPQILKQIQKSSSELEIPIRTSPYYKSFSLFAFDLAKPSKHIGPIPFELKKGKEKEEKILSLSFENLSPFFEKNHHYKWLLMPESSESFLIESEDFFRWGS